MDEYKRALENLGKYQRNISQMTEAEKVRYKAPLMKLKKTIADDINVFQMDFMLSGCRFAPRETDTGDWKGCIRRFTKIYEEYADSGEWSRPFNKVLMKTFSIDKYLESLLPMHYRFWYEGYGPYWLEHCSPTFEKEFTFQNDIIGMEWWEEYNEWAEVKIENGKKTVDYYGGVTIMLPPTQDLLEKAYKEDLEGLT